MGYGNIIQTGELSVTGFIDDLAFTPDNSILVASEKDHFLTWNANTGEPIRVIQGPEDIRSKFILFTSDGKTMITAGSDASIRLWDFDAGKVTQTLEGHRGGIVGLVLSPSGKLLASSSVDRSIRIWDVETGKQVHELSGTAYPATVLIFSEDEKKLATFGGSGGLRDQTNLKTESWQWNIESGEAEDKDVFAGFGPPYAVTADGTSLIGYSEVKTQVSSTKFESKFGLRRYNIATKEFGSDLLNSSYFGYGMSFSCMEVAPNKAVLAIAVGKTGTFGGTGIHLWNGKTPGFPVESTLVTIPSYCELMTFSPDSRMIASWRDDLKVKIYTAP